MGKKRKLLRELKYRKKMYKWEKQRYRADRTTGWADGSEIFELEKSLRYINYLISIKNRK